MTIATSDTLRLSLWRSVGGEGFHEKSAGQRCSAEPRMQAFSLSPWGEGWGEGALQPFQNDAAENNGAIE